MTLFEALTGGAFDRLNWQHSGEFDQNFSKKSNAPVLARGGMGSFKIDWYIRLRLEHILCYLRALPTIRVHPELDGRTLDIVHSLTRGK